MINQTLNHQDAERIRNEALSVAKKHTQHSWDLAEYLYRTSWYQVTSKSGATPFFQTFGFNSWRAYVEKELGLSYQYAQGLRRAFWVFEVELKGKWDRKQLLPASKMTILARVARASNVDDLLTRAAKIPSDELRVRLAGKTPGKSVGGLDGPTMYTYACSVSKAEMKAIEEAVREVRTQNPQYTRNGQALANLCRHFNAGDVTAKEALRVNRSRSASEPRRRRGTLVSSSRSLRVA